MKSERFIDCLVIIDCALLGIVLNLALPPIPPDMDFSFLHAMAVIIPMALLVGYLTFRDKKPFPNYD